MTKVLSDARKQRPGRHAKLKVNEPLVRKPLHSPPPAIYALSAWSVRKSGATWQIAPTAHHFAGKADWQGAYKSLQRATLAIAQKLAREVAKRHKQRCEWYGISE